MCLSPKGLYFSTRKSFSGESEILHVFFLSSQLKLESLLLSASFSPHLNAFRYFVQMFLDHGFVEFHWGFFSLKCELCVLSKY